MDEIKHFTYGKMNQVREEIFFTVVEKAYFD
jgi:hypothetical protein